MSYAIVRDHSCNIVVLNVHTPYEDRSDEIKDSFYEELGCVFEQIPRYDMKILLGDSSAKVEREDIFKLTIGNESSHEVRNDSGVRVVNFAHLKTYFSKGQCSLIAAVINTRGPLLRERCMTKLIMS
jgi:hypothetical protein